MLLGNFLARQPLAETRLAKKYWFNDFAAYRNAGHDAAAKAQALQTRLDPDRPGANNTPGQPEFVNK